MLGQGPRSAHHGGVRPGLRVVAGVVGGLVLVGVVGLILGRGPRYRSTTTVGSASAELYFTTFSPESVRKVAYQVNRGQLTFGQRTVIARLPGADGAVFSPGGGLLVGGGNGSVYSVDTGSGRVTSVAAGTKGFMLSPTPAGRQVYTAGLPGPLAVLDTDPLRPGRTVTLAGDDTALTGIAFAPNGKVIYTSSDPGGTGDIGTIDLTSGQTHRLFQNVAGAHGALYDPYSDSFITMGGSTILQLSATNPSQIVSEATLAVNRVDQGAVDGHGRLFAASNGGDLVLIDYSATKKVGSLADRISTSFLASNLDDVAPLIGAGAAPTPTLARWFADAGDVAFVLAALAGLTWLASTVAGWQRRRIPRWDRRSRVHAGGP